MAYYFYINKVLFPITPARFNIKIKNQNKTVTLINEGEVNQIKKPGLSDIEIPELILPLYQNYPFAVYKNGFKSADYYLDKLEAWKTSRKPQTVILSRISPNGKILLFDTNIQATIEDYEILEDVEKYGFDIAVKLSMKQYMTWGAKKLVIKSIKNSSGRKRATKKKTRRTTRSPSKIYTVKSSDCNLYAIAKKQLGDGSKYKSIYTLNKKVIEAAAKKHGRKSSSNGHWIYAGTKLKLPSK